MAKRNLIMKALRVLGVAAAIVGAPLPALADAPAIAIAQVTDYHGNMQRCVDHAVDVLRARNFFDNTADDTVNGFAGDDYSILIRCATSNHFVYFVVAGPAYPIAQKILEGIANVWEGRNWRCTRNHCAFPE